MSQTLLIQNGDVVISAMSGRPAVVTGRSVLKQDLLENLSINTLQNGYGAGITSLVGYVPINPGPFIMTIDNSIRNSIRAMQSLQKSQTSISRPNDELIKGISFLRVYQDTTDPRVYLYHLNVETIAGPQLQVASTIQG